MPRNNQRTNVSRQELQRLEARLTSLAGRTARQTGDSDELPVDSVDTVNIANDAVTEDKIADGAVTFKKLASGGTTSGGGGNYSSQAETRRSGATTTTEIYYTARPDGDGYAESEVTTSTPAGAVIERRLYYSDKFDADPDTSGDWTAYTTQPADDTPFATAKASLLAGLSDTDGTANTRGTLPVSLKMEHQFATDLLLEDYPGAEAAYSVRKIRGAYTGDAMRIREDSGNTETDIGFDSNGDLDTAAIASHCGSANGYVVTWYDQSGNGNHAAAAVTTKQPQIYDGSSVITDNGRPAIKSDGTDDGLSCTLSAAVAQPISVSTVVTDLFAGGTAYLAEAGGSAFVLFGSSSSVGINNGAWLIVSHSQGAGQNKLFALYSGTGSKIAIDGTQVASGNAGTNGIASGATHTILGITAGSARLNGNLQEYILWPSDEYTSNRTNIESDIETYYKLTTQLLLDTYSGAAAAYSVRQLSQWYTGNCMKVRRDSDDTTQDIGFDSNGDLDTAAIKTFCDAGGAGTLGYVDTWYDQSGNGRDASQSTTSSQPEIYDGSAVFTENGKPIIRESSDFFGNYHLDITFSSGLSSNSWIGCVITNYGPVNHKNSLLQGESNAQIFMHSQAGSTASAFNGLGSGGVTLYKDGSSWSATTRGDVYTDTYNVGQLLIMADADLSTYAVSTPNVSLGHRAYTDLGLFSMQEFIIWDADQSSNRTGIESNINTYFSIY
jgi:hypothetical protein